MTVSRLTRPHKVAVNRTQLRQNQNATLRRAKGNRIVVVSARGQEQKLVLDKEYFDEVLRKLQSALETLEITMDRKMFNQILRAARTLDDDVRRGKLHSFGAAFGDD
jgi:predicted AlkP superfamily phosphohydrolase/phosphomutase